MRIAAASLLALAACASSPPPKAPSSPPKEAVCHEMPDECYRHMAEDCRGRGHVVSETEDGIRYACDRDWDQHTPEPSTQASGPSAGEVFLRALGGAAGGAAAGLNASQSSRAGKGGSCYSDADCDTLLRCAKGAGKMDGVCVER